MVNIISDVLYTFLSSSNLDKAILFATEVGDNRFKKSLKNNLFEDIVSCKYDEIVKNTENGSDCTFYFFKSDVDSFALNNKYVMNNRKKVLTLFQR